MVDDLGNERQLTFTRFIDAPPEKVYRAWTEPELLVQWFTPRPYTTPHAKLDVRPGGSNLVVMRDPEGVETPHRGVYLDVVPARRLVITDAYSSAWEPSEKPFMTLVLTFEAEGAGTRYTAHVLHWSAADRQRHEEMGFHAGWGLATDQMQALLNRI